MLTERKSQDGIKAGEVPFPPMSVFNAGKRRGWQLTDRELAVLASCDVLALSFVKETGALPPYAGVYFLIVRKQVMYVGHTWRLDLRWKHHTHREHLSDPTARIAFLIVNRPVLRGQVERFFIKRFQPPLNRLGRNR